MDLWKKIEISLIYVSFYLTLVGAQSCTFYQGSTTLVRTCTEGCCDTGCCSNDYLTLAIILGTVFGCLFVVFVVAIIVVCVTRDRWSKRISPRNKDAAKKKNDDVMLTDMEANNTASV